MTTHIDLLPVRTALEDAMSAFEREATPAHRDAVLLALAALESAVQEVPCRETLDVLIVGPSGSGKTALASALYGAGFTGRVVDCLPDGSGALVDGKVVDTLPALAPGSLTVRIQPGEDVTIERAGRAVASVPRVGAWQERVAARVLGRELG